MLCQKCNTKTASVFISSIIYGQEKKLYLCKDCAKDYKLLNFKFSEPFSIKDIMDKFKMNENNLTDKDIDLLAMDKDIEYIKCPNCNITYEEYRETGKLGCSRCYETFEKQLKLIIKNMYSNEEYIGKSPKKCNDNIYISKQIRILKEELNRAIDKEEYEKAADIRDKIKELQKCSE